MPHDKAESSHTVEILAVEDEASKTAVARAVAEASKGLTFEQTRARIESLPWILTRSAPKETAVYLVTLMEAAGATVRVEPPLKEPSPHVTSPHVQVFPRLGATPPSPDEAIKDWPTGKSAASTPAGFRIEPLTLMGILARSLLIWKHDFWGLIGISLIFMLMSFAVTLVAEPALHAVKSTASLAIALWMIALAFAIGASAVIGCGFAGAMYYAVSSVYLRREFGVFSSYRFALSKVPALVYTSLLFLLTFVALLLGPTILSIVLVEGLARVIGSGRWQGLIYLFIAFAPTIIAFYAMSKLLVFDRVVVLEDKKGVRALKRSWNLLSGKADGSWPARYWLRWIVLTIIVVLIWITIRVLLVAAVDKVAFFLPESLAVAGTLLWYVIPSLGDAVALVLWSACGIVFYFDVRHRKEGFDLGALATASLMRR